MFDDSDFEPDQGSFDNSDFEPDAPTPEAPVEDRSYADTQNPVSAAVISGLDAATFGNLDEISGRVKSLLTGMPTDEAVAMARRRLDALRGAQPGGSAVGDFAGSLASTAALPGGAVTKLALAGGLSGYGRSDGSSLAPVVTGAATGAALGSLGKYLPAVGRILQKHSAGLASGITKSGSAAIGGAIGGVPGAMAGSAAAGALAPVERAIGKGLEKVGSSVARTGYLPSWLSGSLQNIGGSSAQAAAAAVADKASQGTVEGAAEQQKQLMGNRSYRAVYSQESKDGKPSK